MVLKVFAVFDSKAGFFGQPFFDQREASAIRMFGDAVNDGSNSSNQWFKHPEDFQLFVIGEFNNETGDVKGCLPVALVNASSLKNGSKELELDFSKNGNEGHLPVSIK